MRTIWKYPLETTDRQVLSMPQGARIIAVQTQTVPQSDKRVAVVQPCLWAIVNPAAPKVDVEIRIHGTGHELPDDCGQYEYLGTYQLSGGALVFHAFRLLSPAEVLGKLL